MRTFVMSVADLYGPASCAVMSLRGREHRQALPARMLAAGHTTSATRLPFVRKLEFAARSVVAAVRRRGRLVVIAGHPHLSALAWLAGRLAGAPIVVWVYGKESWAPLGGITGWSLRKADAVLAITHYTAEAAVAAQGLPTDRVHVVHLCLPPWQAGRTPSVPRTPGSVLCVARLDRDDMYKGVDTLVTAWPIVAQSVPDACLLLVGEGNDRARIERIAQEAAVLDSVRFLGRVSDERLRTLYAEVCLFALPGRASMGEAPEGEGFGLVFIEAQAAGLPVVAGRAAGAREAVLDGETGLLVDPEDPSDVARAIIALLEDGRRRDDMARAGVEFVATQFSYDRFTRQIADVLQRITET